MRYVVTAAQMRELDSETITAIGIPGAVLMETAGRAVASAVWDELGSVATSRVAVVCGAGNNGGDGYVIARVLRARGVSATVYLAAARDRIGGDAAVHLGAYEQSGGLATSIADLDQLAEHRAAIESADVVVDALFGTGLTRSVEGHLAQVIEVINRSAGRIVSVDVPSGLSADTGAELGACVRADVTVTMAFSKIGLAVAPGSGKAGRVIVAEIGIPEQLAAAHGIGLALLEPGDLRPLVPARNPLDHKNRRGHVLVVAGSPGKRGAARLTASAALRSGAGLATLASDKLDDAAPDPLMTAVLDCEQAGAIDRLLDLAEGKAAVAMGPGMPTGSASRDLVKAAVERIGVAMVLDADALNHLAGDVAMVAKASASVVLTPHPGEAGRLLGCQASEVQADRVAAVRKLAEQSGAVILLKGAGTLVCDGRVADDIITINPTGGPELATAGSGDVLTGVIAALIAQGLAPGEAARLAAYIHGSAGHLAAQRLGPIGVTATDVLESLPAAFASLGQS